MNNVFEKAEAAKFSIRKLIGDINISCAIITGTGLGNIWKEFDIIHTIEYTSIPHFPKNTVQSHQGKLFICSSNEKYVAIFSGRFHFYEGYSANQTTFIIRVMERLEINRLLLTNVSGGLNASYLPGTIVGIKDHINLQPEHPLRGKNNLIWGPRFPDMLNTYNQQILQKLSNFAIKSNIDFHVGVYLALQGPSLETPAEYEFAHNIGADMVGMSTVPEAITAHHMGIEITAISVISNVCYPITRLTETSIESVIHIGEKAVPNLNKLIHYWIALI